MFKNHCVFVDIGSLITKDFLTFDYIQCIDAKYYTCNQLV